MPQANTISGNVCTTALAAFPAPPLGCATLLFFACILVAAASFPGVGGLSVRPRPNTPGHAPSRCQQLHVARVCNRCVKRAREAGSSTGNPFRAPQQQWDRRCLFFILSHFAVNRKLLAGQRFRLGGQVRKHHIISAFTFTPHHTKKHQKRQERKLKTASAPQMQKKAKKTFKNQLSSS